MAPPDLYDYEYWDLALVNWSGIFDYDDEAGTLNSRPILGFEGIGPHGLDFSQLVDWHEPWFDGTYDEANNVLDGEWHFELSIEHYIDGPF